MAMIRIVLAQRFFVIRFLSGLVVLGVLLSGMIKDARALIGGYKE